MVALVLISPFLYLALLENYPHSSGLKTLSGSIFSAPDCFSF